MLFLDFLSTKVILSKISERLKFQEKLQSHNSTLLRVAFWLLHPTHLDTMNLSFTLKVPQKTRKSLCAKGDNESPYLRPLPRDMLPTKFLLILTKYYIVSKQVLIHPTLLGDMLPTKSPLIIIEYYIVSKQVLIHPIHFSLKPILASIPSDNSIGPWTLSKALLILILKATSPIFPFVLHFMWWRILKAIITLSKIECPSTKEYCSKEIHFWSNGLRRLASVLEIIM